MINRAVIEERVREWGLREDVVEKDYVLGWLLWGIGADEALATHWVFKGGTCLKKCYLETYRFSEDLDFTVMPGGPIRAEELLPILQRVLDRVQDACGVSLREQPPKLKTHSSGLYTEGRVYYRGPRNTPQVASVRLDLSASEKAVRPSVLRKISHAFPDELPAPGSVRCYSFEEVFAEKIRAMGERCRPRDLYDIVNLFRRRDLRSQPALIRQVLIEKCESKGVPVPTFTTLQNSPFRSDLESEWANMLAHQLPSLPPFDSFWDELPALFQWLEGQLVEAELQALPITEEPDEQWAPPATVWTWGVGVPVESIRFAAANHLCIELGYQGSTRLIEPYALRRTKAGHVLLCAVKQESRESRSYRLDRIQSIKVTTRPFKPAFRVELTSSGPIQVPALTRPRATVSPWAHTGFKKPERMYVIQCSGCGKDFKRKTLNCALKPHKGPGGWPCHTRRGFLANTIYE